ncbi:sporozoite surface protein 2-like [Spodoptera litura]|uniref:Sporozoite surface protein 2-like n=1 Tax=Spodoptera litura TaxID=69820 RepID=A0A9J7DST1_SPOLT|nr:sporozoite surface protein 2-like [Spodoptera litura]
MFLSTLADIHRFRTIIIILMFIEFKLLEAQVSTANNNEGNLPTSVEPRFLDLGALGFPNFGSGRFGNPTSNYPTNSFFPYGNQNNIQRPQQGYPNQGNFRNKPSQGYGQEYPNQQGYPIQQGYPNQQAYPDQQSYPNQSGYPNQLGYPNQPGYPNQQGYPYLGDSMNPIYQRPEYPSEDFQNRPIERGYPNQGRFPYQGDNEYSNYQKPEYFNRPGEGPAMYPEDMNRQNYQNPRGPLNQAGYFNQPGLAYPTNSFGYPPGNQYPSPGFGPANGNPSYRPDEVGNLPDTNVNFPDALGQFQPYNPQNPNFEQPGAFQNNIPGADIQLPNQMGGSDNPSVNQYPNSVAPFPGGPENVPPLVNEPPPSDSQGGVPNNNETAGILGKPVIVPPELVTTAPDETVPDNSTEDATKKKCVQDCPSTSEYNPVCGTDNVTYINPGKFLCAQNCGVAVQLLQRGRCDSDVIM